MRNRATSPVLRRSVRGCARSVGGARARPCV